MFTLRNCNFIISQVFVTAFAVLISATVHGHHWKKIRWNILLKSLEGTLAFFFSSCFVVLLAPKVEGNLTSMYWDYCRCCWHAKNISGSGQMTIFYSVAVVLRCGFSTRCSFLNFLLCCQTFKLILLLSIMQTFAR